MAHYLRAPAACLAALLLATSAPARPCVTVHATQR